MYDRFVRRAIEQRRELRAQKCGMLEHAVGVQVQGERPIVRAGNVAGDSIDGFDVAAKSFRRARVDQKQGMSMQACTYAGGIHSGRDAMNAKR